jgi:hypothetical protein
MSAHDYLPVIDGNKVETNDQEAYLRVRLTTEDWNVIGHRSFVCDRR